MVKMRLQLVSFCSCNVIEERGRLWQAMVLCLIMHIYAMLICSSGFGAFHGVLVKGWLQEMVVTANGKPRVAITNKPLTEQTCTALTLVLVGVLSGRDVTKLG